MTRSQTETINQIAIDDSAIGGANSLSPPTQIGLLPIRRATLPVALAPVVLIPVMDTHHVPFFVPLMPYHMQLNHPYTLHSPLIHDPNPKNNEQEQTRVCSPNKCANDTNGSIPTQSAKIKPHICKDCGKTFKHKANLKIHSKVHSAHALTCSYCAKKFARKSNLVQHIRVHTGEKPHRCTKCTKAFRQKHSLLDHMRKHTGETPFGCEFCDKRFTARCNYVVHRRIHTGEKPYSCEFCGKRFTSKSGYNSHRNNQHGHVSQ